MSNGIYDIELQNLTKFQPIYPLNNFTVVQLLPRTDQARWVAECFELYRCLNDFHQLIEASRRQAQITKIASLSRLERSLISNRVAAVSKDSTVQLVPFLSSTMESLQRYLAGGFSPECWRVSFRHSFRRQLLILAGPCDTIEASCTLAEAHIRNFERYEL